MIIMRKNIIIAIVAILAAAVPSGAKSKTLSSFIDKVSSSLVSFEYSFTMRTAKSSAKMTGSGDVRVQDNAFVGVELCPLVRRIKNEIAQ